MRARDLILSLASSRFFIGIVMIITLILAIVTRPKKSDDEVEKLSEQIQKAKEQERIFDI
ncbi:MAG: hypothetical protein PUJ57_01950 [Peptoniphilaceae bacterium]|nr:hypothetical protein [Peptoniphilaceae bacterium]